MAVPARSIPPTVAALLVLFAASTVVAGAGIWWMWTADEPAEVCRERAPVVFEQLEERAEPFAAIQLQAPSRDLECWDDVPMASITVALPKETNPADALRMLGDEWQVEGHKATTADSQWWAMSHRGGRDERRVTVGPLAPA